MDQLQAAAIIASGILFFVVLWLFVVWLTAQIGGWSKLAGLYPARLPFDESCRSWQSARFRWGMGYNGILKVCADTQALHLSVFPIFRPGNPPLSIPWEDITGRRQFVGVELRFRRAASIPIRISRQLADRLEKASGGIWHYDRA